MSTNFAGNTAIDPRAEIDDEVEIGPFCVIGPEVRIGRGTRLENNVTLMGNVTIGCYNHIYPNVVIGGEPQDISYRGSDTKVHIGDHNIIRECVTINRASEKEDGVTRVGDHNFLMACCHVAHDCQLGNHIVIANGTLLAGHVHVHDYASLSGAVAVHHFATIGSYCFLAGLAPFGTTRRRTCSSRAVPRPRCINSVGLKRNNFSPQVIQALAEAHKLLYRSKVGLENAWEILLRQRQLGPPGESFVEFRSRPARGPARPRPRTTKSRVKKWLVVSG